MKLLPKRYREATTEFYGKAGKVHTHGPVIWFTMIIPACDLAAAALWFGAQFIQRFEDEDGEIDFKVTTLHIVVDHQSEVVLLLDNLLF